MPLIGLHCSHEQIPPSRLLTHVQEAEAAGFRAAMSSDHFSPWSERQGESGFAWSFLGAA
jgi:alkanesulfonate monooxygenase SsuD/methylene tetrahydromethanopterin reductase-like flavin-dependent oxidoreductase (luciferase family)